MNKFLTVTTLECVINFPMVCLKKISCRKLYKKNTMEIHLTFSYFITYLNNSKKTVRSKKKNTV